MISFDNQTIFAINNTLH